MSKSIEPPMKVVIEVSRKLLPLDPPIYGYEVEIVANGGSVGESFGSKESLNAYLLGVGHGLLVVSMSASPRWHWEDHHQLPVKVRWTIEPGQMSKMEELDEEGNVLRI